MSFCLKPSLFSICIDIFSIPSSKAVVTGARRRSKYFIFLIYFSSWAYQTLSAYNIEDNNQHNLAELQVTVSILNFKDTL